MLHTHNKWCICCGAQNIKHILWPSQYQKIGICCTFLWDGLSNEIFTLSFIAVAQNILLILWSSSYFKTCNIYWNWKTPYEMCILFDHNSLHITIEFYINYNNYDILFRSSHIGTCHITRWFINIKSWDIKDVVISENVLKHSQKNAIDLFVSKCCKNIMTT